MQAIQPTTSEKLKQYITDFDNQYIPSLIQSIVLCKFDGTLPNSTEDDLNVIFTGVRVYSRVMQGIDIDSETNIDFYTQNSTVQGLRGRHFIDLIGNRFSLKTGSEGVQMVIMAGVKTIPVLGQIASLLDVIFAPIKKGRIDEMKLRLSVLIDKFNDFLNDWTIEDKKQHPEKYAVIDPTDPTGKPKTPTTFKVVSNTDGTITVSNIITGDLVSIDGATGLIAKGDTFTSVALSDGEHTISVKGQSIYSYADTVKVTTKAAFLSSPVAFVNNNKALVIGFVVVVFGVVMLWKRGYFSQN